MASAILGLVLDSSVLVAAERAKRTTPDVLPHIRAAVGDVPIIICVLTVAELAHGIHRANSPERRQQRRQFLDEFTTAERTNLWYHRFGEPKSTKVTNFSEATLFNGAMSPDGRSMLVTRGPQDQDAFLIRNFR